MTIEAIGYGAGSADPPGLANVVRLFVGTTGEAHGGETLWVLETNLDDTPGEVVGYATGRLLEAGAVDVFVTPVLMKKNRPGVMITALCDARRVAECERVMLSETTTLGVRRYPVQRRTLRRKAIELETPFGTLRGKLAWAATDAQPPRFSPEFDDCARAAAEHGVPLAEVYEAARAAYMKDHATHATHAHGPA
jgi:uncharacterized protein (DUF111 family)